MIQNWAIRYFLGIHRFTLILAFTGDMDWVSEIKAILGQVNLLASFHDKTPVNLKQVVKQKQIVC